MFFSSKKPSFRLTALLAVLLLLVGCTSQTSSDPADSSDPTENSDAAAAVGTPVEVATVARSDLASQARLSGKVAATRDVAIMAPLTAKVTAVYVSVGDQVQSGQVLFSLDKSDLQSSYNSLADNYARSKKLMEAQIEQAKINYDNTAALLEIGAASQMELDAARIALLSAETTASTTLRQLEDNMKTLRDTLADADVKSTISGRVSSLSAVAGSWASPTTPAAVVSEGGTQVSVSVSETVQPYLIPGDTATVYISSLSDDPFLATIRTVSPSAGAMTQLFDVVLDLPSSVTATAGMFATVIFETERRENAIIIPNEAILNDGISQSVFVMEDGKAYRRIITTGLIGDGVVEVTEGLSGGEQLVVVGQSYLSEGAAVRVMEG